MEVNKLKVGESFIVKSNLYNRFPEQVQSTILKKYFQDKTGNKITVGEKIELTNSRGKKLQFKVFKILGNDLVVLRGVNSKGLKLSVLYNNIIPENRNITLHN